MKCRILTDVDGVLADFIGGVCNELTRRGYGRTPEDFRHFELKASLPPDELRSAFQIMSEPGFCHSLDWYRGAQGFLAALSQFGEVHAVTAPLLNSPSWMHERMSWLSSNIDSERVHFVAGKYKHLIRGDVLIEDHPGNAREWLDANPGHTAILIDRPWNSPSANEFWPHRNMYRVRSYADALMVLKELFA